MLPTGTRTVCVEVAPQLLVTVSVNCVLLVRTELVTGVPLTIGTLPGSIVAAAVAPAVPPGVKRALKATVFPAPVLGRVVENCWIFGSGQFDTVIVTGEDDPEIPASLLVAVRVYVVVI